MKRFVAFVGDTYYPSRGFGDFVGSFDTQTEAREAAIAKQAEDVSPFTWADVWDTDGDRPTRCPAAPAQPAPPLDRTPTEDARFRQQEQALDNRFKDQESRTRENRFGKDS